jgi:hypothetical protein
MLKHGLLLLLVFQRQYCKWHHCPRLRLFDQDIIAKLMFNIFYWAANDFYGNVLRLLNKVANHEVSDTTADAMLLLMTTSL